MSLRVREYEYQEGEKSPSTQKKLINVKKDLYKEYRRRNHKTPVKSPVLVEKEDIKSIGNTKFEENNMTCFICDFETSHIEKILLRTILQTFGNDFKIVGECDHPYGMIFKTNFPWEKYNSVNYKL